MRRRRVYSIELKRLAVSRVLAGESVSAVAAEKDIGLNRLYEWVALARRGQLEPVRGPGRPTKEEALRRAASGGPLVDQRTAAQRRIAQLERKIAQQELDLDFFRQALRHVKARQQVAAGHGRPLSTKSSKR
jgi:transposase